MVTNHLTAAIMKYFTDSYRLSRAAEFFERLISREPEISSLLARCYIGMSESARWCLCASTDSGRRGDPAVKIMHQALQDNPLSYPTLHAQCDFLLSKGKPEWARQIAQQAVNAAPSEFRLLGQAH